MVQAQFDKYYAEERYFVHVTLFLLIENGNKNTDQYISDFE